MNEPIFTLEEAPEGTRRIFADPWSTQPGMTRPKPTLGRPRRARLLAGVFGIGAAASRRLFPARS
jgi:hypothetical protein